MYKTLVSNTPLVISFCLILALFAQVAQADTSPMPYNEKEVKERLNAISDPLFKPKYDKIVKAYIMGYVLRNRKNSEHLLGRTTLYFPIFEKLLKERNLPEALKYLPIVESALHPKALSRVGAGGLWQFMPGTAKEYGLHINRYVDERFDPHKSTEAALNYLQRQHEKFESWPLALAAYNGGSGRVSRAIKRGRSRNFWKIKRFLPRETRNYVSAYLAAVYLVEYHKAHDLTPKFPSLDHQLVETIRITDYVSFYRIAQVTGVPVNIIEQLNPAYERSFIPENPNGNYLILPERVMPAFKDFLEHRAKADMQEHPINASPVVIATPGVKTDEEYAKKTIPIDGRKTLTEIAEQANCSEYHLRLWNEIPNDSTALADTLITIFKPKKVKRFNPIFALDQVDALPTTLSTIQSLHPTFSKNADILLDGGQLYFAPPKKMRLRDIPEYLPELDLKQLINLNKMKPKDWVDKGEHIIIRKL